MAVRVRNPGRSNSYGNQTTGWYSNRRKGRQSSYPWCNNTNQTKEARNRDSGYHNNSRSSSSGYNGINDRTRQRYGYGYRMTGFSKAMVTLGVAAGALLKGCGTLAKKSFNSAKDYTDSVKANRKEREENVYYTEEAEFDEVNFSQGEMLEILDIPANSLMCATETGVKLAKKCAEALQE